MDQNEKNRLIHRRQYLLTPEPVECPFNHTTLKIGSQYSLYAHTDLKTCEFKTKEKQLVLLGDMFDYIDPSKDNSGILQELATSEFPDLLVRCGDFAGRYVLIIAEKDRFIILHDATAARKVYFSERNSKVWFGSNSHLLAKVLNIQASRIPSKLEYYRSPDFIKLNNSDLGNTTYYDEITQLMSNHYYDLSTNEEIRYWPVEQPEQLSFQEVADKCTTILDGHMKSIYNRYNLMLPVTAGGDSRLLMAATKDFSNDVFYYLNKIVSTSYESRDIKTSEKLFRLLGINFNLLKLSPEVDPEFKEIYFKNNPFASDFFLPHIYNYYLEHQDKINLPGNIASSPWMVYLVNKKNVTIEEITKYYQVNKIEYIQPYYQKWMENIKTHCNCSGLNVMSLFYWEERINNWGNQISGDKDIAQDEVNPLNSRILNELYLSLPLKYNNEPDKLLHKKIIMNLWPELMKLPFNPSKRRSAMMFLTHLGIFTPVARLLYKISPHKF